MFDMIIANVPGATDRPAARPMVLVAAANSKPAET
jgi:hypothetical protein